MRATLKSILFFSLLCSIFVLTGCSSGSSGSSSGAQPIPIFDSWDSISSSSSIQSNSTTISTEDDEPRYEQLLLDFDEDKSLDQITTGSDTSQQQVFNRNPHLTIDGASELSLFNKSSDVRDWLIAFNPSDEVWKYQSMALWLDVKNLNDINVGVLSFGNITVPADIPSQQNISFTGKSIGLYIDASNNRYLTQATITANLQGNMIELKATDTYRWGAPSFNITNIGNNIPARNTETRDNDLDFMTNLTHNSSRNSFDSDNVTTNGGLQGAVKAQFYGPEAQELGGVFRMTDDNGSSYAGAFGAKK
ncbi:MAG: transferrin-binding protein-like solute binding protein [Alphaproteobacteria bacterium]|nr:transferrin-binding protein-like solute binding protein [Alphaproteobacteria bacterium]